MFKELWNNKKTIGQHYYNFFLQNKRLIVSIIVLGIVLILYSLFQYNSYLDRQKMKNVTTEVKEAFKNYEELLKLQNKKSSQLSGAGKNINKQQLFKNSQFLKYKVNETVNGNNSNVIINSDSNGNNSIVVDNNNTELGLRGNSDGLENYTYVGLIKYIEEEYLSKMNAVNMIARGFDTKVDVIAKYQDLCQDITQEDMLNVNNSVSEYLTQEEEKLQVTYLDGYFKYWIPKIVLGKGRNWLETGMPHTHQNVIIMDEKWFSNIRMGTFIHEIGHVHQRLEGEEWEELIKNWGFSSCQSLDNKIVGLDSLLIRNRLNPDGMDCYWRWKDNISSKSYWIGAVFKSDEPESLHNVEYIGVELEWNAENGLWYLTDRKTSLNKLPAFIAYFGLDHDNYHPHEIGSHYLEKLLEETVMGQTDVSNTRGYQIFRKWFIKTYGTRLDTNVSFKKRKSIRDAEAKERGAVKHIVNGKKIYEWNVLQNYPWIKIDEESGSNYPLKSMEKMNSNGGDFQVRKRDYYDFGDITYIGNPL